MAFLPCGSRNAVHVKYEPCSEEKFITPSHQPVEYGPLIASSIITTPLVVVSLVWLRNNSLSEADILVLILLLLTALLIAVNVALGFRLWHQIRSLEQIRYLQYIENVSSSHDDSSRHLSCWLNRTEEDEEEHHRTHTQQPILNI